MFLIEVHSDKTASLYRPLMEFEKEFESRKYPGYIYHACYVSKQAARECAIGMVKRMQI